MQLCHQHGRSHALSGNVPDPQDHLTAAIFGENQVAIVAADQPCRLIVVVNVPTIDSRKLLWEQSMLNLGGELQIIFQINTLVPVEMVEANARDGIGEQGVRFNAAFTYFTDAEAAAL